MLRDGRNASIDTIAAAAGVARRTIFNHFGSKEALFEAILVRCGQESLPRLILKTKGDVRANMLDFARRYVTAVTGPSVVMIYRMLRAGAHSIDRLHELQKEHYLNLRNMLAVYFSDCISAGTLKQFNTRFGAERFMASVVGMSRVEVSLGIEPQREDRDAYIQDAVDGFLEALLI
jgi:TetR/AcrR family transcriptional regulator, mexJK operon transcriptional repressor